jgi:opacity protein-like surface antigen
LERFPPASSTYTAPEVLPFSNLRADRIELFAEAGYMRGADAHATIDGDQQTLSTSSHWLGGAGFGYNIGPYFNLNFDGLANSERLTDTVSNGVSTASSKENVYSGKFMFNVEYYPFKACITPILTGGVGVIYTWNNDIFDNDMYLSETDLAYDAGAGLRWDITRNMFAKVIYKATWSKFHNFDDRQLYDGLFFSIGWKF